MSPLNVRRYRAERLLRREFASLRGRVLSVVRARLRASGVSLDPSDLEACYAQAWQGLYTLVLDGREIANPAGWLALVTFRRAIDEHRARVPSARLALATGPDSTDAREPACGARDLAEELDDRAQLRHLFEGLRGRLSVREQQAAALCYLQGLSRAEAAGRMGISEARMRKLMEGRGPGRPGVAGKVGELLATIRGGAWCEEQASSMRGLAFGVLDPAGERYRLALAHRRECPACRAYVLSLRGLAAVLPPLPVLLPWALGAGAGAGAGGVATGAGAGTGMGAGTGAGVATGAGAGTLSGAGAVGAGGAAGGSWFLAGGAGAKLAVGCMVALSVGASCVALSVAPVHLRRAPGADPHHTARRSSAATAGAYAAVSLPAGVQPTAAATPPQNAAAGHAPAAIAGHGSTALASAAKASREFGPEQTLAGSVSSHAAPARAHSAGSAPAGEAEAPTAASTASARASGSNGAAAHSSGGSGGSSGGGSGGSGGASAAQREFGPG
jgi:DNA-directed RNA polymerase specialized sigma24 family protein